jgi:LEA14-like dessication related protein
MVRTAMDSKPPRQRDDDRFIKDDGRLKEDGDGISLRGGRRFDVLTSKRPVLPRDIPPAPAHARPPRAAVFVRWARLSFFLLMLTGCSVLAPKFTKPELSVASVELVGGNLMQQNFRVTLNIHNPNDRTLPVTRLHIELHIAGEEVATGVNTRAFVVPAHGDTQFDMSITANLALALLKLAGRKDAHADSIDYQMTGGASIDLPFLRDLPFHQNGSLSLNGLRF